MLFLKEVYNVSYLFQLVKSGSKFQVAFFPSTIIQVALKTHSVIHSRLFVFVTVL